MVEKFTNTMAPQQDSLGVVYVRLYNDINTAIRDSGDKRRSAQLLDIRYHLFVDFVAAQTSQDAHAVIQRCRRQFSTLMTPQSHLNEFANPEHQASVGAD